LIEKESNNKRVLPNSNSTAMLITCISIDFLFWLGNKLSHEYNGVLIAKVNYNNIPNDYMLGSNTTQQVKLLVRAKGFFLLFDKLKKNKISTDINAALLPLNKTFVTSESIKNIIAATLNKNYALIEVQPDTFFYSFDKRFTKKIPVKLIAEIDFEPQHGLSEKIIITPVEVEISGHKKDVTDLKFLETETLIFNKLKESKTGSVKIKSPMLINVVIDPNVIEYAINVEKYTEQVVEVPVRIVNVPNKSNMTIYPKKIKVTCLVSLNDFEKVKADLFEAVADFYKVDMKEDKLVDITLKRQPSFVKNINWSPKRAEFIMNKQ
jgi:YbbR domain-containing protein